MRLLVLTVLAIASCLSNTSSVSAGELLKLEGHLMRWAPEADGKTIISYSILKGPYHVESDKSILSPSNCAKMHAFGGIVANSPGLDETKVKAELQSALRAWESVANVTFVEIADPTRANIVIGAADDSGGRAFANLSYRSEKGLTPVTMALGKPDVSKAQVSNKEGGDGSIVPIDQAYVCLNPKMRWKVGFDGNLDVYDLRHTFTHEIGHAIGLDHPGASGAIMAFRYDESVRELQPSDIAGIQRLYGPHIAP